MTMFRTSSNWRLTVFVTAIILVVGCGGGGAGFNDPGGFGFTPKAGQYIEFADALTNELVDPLNLEVGDEVQMVLANYDALGTRTRLSTGQWSVINAAAAIALDANSGRFIVMSNTGAFVQFRTTTVIGGNSTMFAQDGNVPPVLPTLTGRVVELGAFSGLPTNTGIAYVQVDFFNSVGTRVGSARTDGDGAFTASVPTTTTHLMVDSDSIKTTHFYRSVYYVTKYYSPLISNCKVPIDPIVSGPNVLAAPVAIPVQSGVPPPPPTGCP